MISNLNITTLAPAKINLYLHIHERLKNGYHNLESFIVFINLYDKLQIIPSSKTSLDIKGFSCGTEKDNLIIKIVNYIKNHFKIKHHVKIKLHKLIPVGAGLGGGSADAAAILKALNTLWNLNLSVIELAHIGSQFGADIPSCLYSSSGIIEKIGNKFTPFSLKFKLPILLVSNLLPLSTKDVYSHLTPIHYYKDSSINSTHTQNYNDFIEFIMKQKNNLTRIAINLNKEIKNILNTLNSTTPILSRMTGSGNCCFSIYSNTTALNNAYNKVKQIYPTYFVKKVSSL